jgi:hypothetical protein
MFSHGYLEGVPASIKVTCRFGSSHSRAARVQPAEPAPTMTMSQCVSMMLIQSALIFVGSSQISVSVLAIVLNLSRRADFLHAT